MVITPYRRQAGEYRKRFARRDVSISRSVPQIPPKGVKSTVPSIALSYPSNASVSNWGL